MEAKAPRRPSARTSIPRICNFAIWLAFCALAGTGLLMAFRLPPGSRGGNGLSALSWGRHDWGDFHSWVSYAFLALIVVHLALHWRWFWQVAGRKKLWPILLGTGAGVALIVAAFFVPVHKDRQGEGPGRPRNHQRGR